MGSGIVNEGAPLRSNQSYSDIFDEMFPHYLNLGMTYDLYWNDRPELAKMYREAYKMKCDQDNTNAWLQGRYFYDAICMASPILHAFAKKGTKPIPYHEKPFGMEKKETVGLTEAEKSKQQSDIGIAQFMAFASKVKPSGGAEQGKGGGDS